MLNGSEMALSGDENELLRRLTDGNALWHRSLLLRSRLSRCSN
jgi:hypothetical protein